MTIAENKLNIFDCHNIDFGSQNVDFGNQKLRYVKNCVHDCHLSDVGKQLLGNCQSEIKFCLQN